MGIPLAFLAGRFITEMRTAAVLAAVTKYLTPDNSRVPGGICISSSVYDHARGKIAVEFADLGEQDLKHIDRLVRVYAMMSDGRRSATQAERVGRSTLSPPRLPSLCCRLPTSAAIQRKTTSSMV
jgi:hypothetical protein